MILLHVMKRPPSRIRVNIQWLYDFKYMLHIKHIIYHILYMHLLSVKNHILRKWCSNPSCAHVSWDMIRTKSKHYFYLEWDYSQSKDEKCLPVKWERKKRHQWWMIPPHEVVVRQKVVQLEITQIKIEWFQSMMLPENASMKRIFSNDKNADCNLLSQHFVGLMQFFG